MIPHIADRGHSFKGAGQYYLHDKRAQTSERVAWTHTHNIPTDDPEKAMKWMAYTSQNSDKLKQETGVPMTGRKARAGSVYSFSLAWHPEEKPEKEKMLDSALDTLGLLGLKDHEAVVVCHQETDHPHIHVIANLVNPNDGRTAVPSYDFLKLSKWAEEHEMENGKIYCEERVKNNEQRRDQAKEDRQLALVKHREEKLKRAEHIQGLYTQSGSGKTFQSAMSEAGYTLAQGDRRGFVIVDDHGKIYSLSRQLKGQRAADIKTRLSDLENLPFAKDVADEQAYFDRDKQGREQLQRIEDAAIEKTKKEKEAAPKEKIKEQKPPSQSPIQERFRELGKLSGTDKLLEKIKEREKEKDPVSLAMAQSKRLSDTIDRERADRARLSVLESKLREEHKFKELEKQIKELKKDLVKNDTFLGRKTGSHQKILDELKDHEKYFGETKQRIQARVDKLKQELIGNRPPQLRPSNDDTLKPKPEKEKSGNVADFEEAAKKKSEYQAKEEEFRKRMRREQEQKAQERDREQGMDLDI